MKGFEGEGSYKEAGEDFREKAHGDYPTIKRIFDKHGIKFFAFYGTALGAVRDGDFIPWDKDLDFASIEPFPKCAKHSVQVDLIAEGFEVILRNPEPDGNLWFKRNVPGDLYWMEKVGSSYVFRLSDGTIAIKIPEKYFGSFKEVKLGDSVVLVPDPPEPYLEATYDKGWRTHKKTQRGKFRPGGEM